MQNLYSHLGGEGRATIYDPALFCPNNIHFWFSAVNMLVQTCLGAFSSSERKLQESCWFLWCALMCPCLLFLRRWPHLCQNYLFISLWILFSLRGVNKWKQN